MLNSLSSRVAVTAFVIVIAGVLLVFVFSIIANGKVVPTGTAKSENTRPIISYIVTSVSNGVMNGTFSYVKADSAQPNSAHIFLNPFGKTINDLEQQLSVPNDPSIDINAILTDKQRQDLLSNSDAYEQYVLIRLPVELGGIASDVSAFRAYSARPRIALHIALYAS